MLASTTETSGTISANQAGVQPVTVDLKSGEVTGGSKFLVKYGTDKIDGFSNLLRVSSDGEVTATQVGESTNSLRLQPTDVNLLYTAGSTADCADAPCLVIGWSVRDMNSYFANPGLEFNSDQVAVTINGEPVRFEVARKLNAYQLRLAGVEPASELQIAAVWTPKGTLLDKTQEETVKYSRFGGSIKVNATITAPPSDDTQS